MDDSIIFKHALTALLLNYGYTIYISNRIATNVQPANIGGRGGRKISTLYYSHFETMFSGGFEVFFLHRKQRYEEVIQNPFIFPSTLYGVNTISLHKVRVLNFEFFKILLKRVSQFPCTKLLKISPTSTGRSFCGTVGCVDRLITNKKTRCFQNS